MHSKIHTGKYRDIDGDSHKHLQGGRFFFKIASMTKTSDSQVACEINYSNKPFKIAHHDIARVLKSKIV